MYIMSKFQLRTIKRLHTPKGYRNISRSYSNRIQKNNDIAILELDRPIKFNENVGRACLPDNDELSPTECLISGWGMEDTSKL